jgi:hypothetical protein
VIDPAQTLEMLKRYARMWPVLVVTLALMALVWYMAPQQLLLFAYKVVAIGLGGIGGLTFFWGLSQSPDDLPEHIKTHYYLQRTIFTCAGMVSVALMA